MLSRTSVRAIVHRRRVRHNDLRGEKGLAPGGRKEGDAGLWWYRQSKALRVLYSPQIHLYSQPLHSFLDRISSRVQLLLIFHRRCYSSSRGIAYSKEGNGDNDAPVLGARELVNGVADVAGVRLGGATEASALGSFGRHVVLCVDL